MVAFASPFSGKVALYFNTTETALKRSRLKNSATRAGVGSAPATALKNSFKSLWYALRVLADRLSARSSWTRSRSFGVKNEEKSDLVGNSSTLQSANHL
jgi:hypothetical protein